MKASKKGAEQWQENPTMALAAGITATASKNHKDVRRSGRLKKRTHQESKENENKHYEVDDDDVSDKIMFAYGGRNFTTISK